MNIKSLMQPRYRVAAKYPHSPYEIGDLVKLNLLVPRPCFYCTKTKYANDMTEKEEYSYNWFELENINQYPYLFKKLEWYEERKLEDMPMYLKSRHEVLKVDLHFKMHNQNEPGKYYDQWSHFVTGDMSRNYIFYSPATEQEYNEYKSKQP